MGITVSRGGKNVESKFRPRVTRTRVTYQGPSRPRVDVRKRALQAEYDAWVRSLGPVEQRERSGGKSDGNGGKIEGNGGKSLFRKVASLLSSKSHRKSRIVWPDDVRKGDPLPQIKLGFTDGAQRGIPHRPAFQPRNSFRMNRSIAPSYDEDFYATSFQSAGYDEPKDHRPQRESKRSHQVLRNNEHAAGHVDTRHTWGIPYDYNAIQGTSSIFGPKVLPTSPANHFAPSSGNNVSKSFNRNLSTKSRDSLSTQLTSSVTTSAGNSPKTISLSEDDKLKHVISEIGDDFRRHFVKNNEKFKKKENTPKIGQTKPTIHNNQHRNQDLTKIPNLVDSTKYIGSSEENSGKMSLSFGPGSENFYLLGSIQNCRKHLRPVRRPIHNDDVIDDVINRGVSPRRPRRPNSDSVAPPNRLWRNDGPMASSLTSMKEATSPYKHYTESQTSGGTWSTASHNTHHDAMENDSETSGSTESFTSEEISYDSDGELTDEDHPSDSGYGIPIAPSGRRGHQYQPHVGARNTRIGPHLEGKIDRMVTSLINERDRGRGIENGGPANPVITADVIQDMIERKLAAALTQIMVPKYRNNL